MITNAAAGLSSGREYRAALLVELEEDALHDRQVVRRTAVCDAVHPIAAAPLLLALPSTSSLIFIFTAIIIVVIVFITSATTRALLDGTTIA
jgi:hypothetical protein